MISISNLSAGYSRHAPVLSGVYAVLPSGALIAMVGCNGSGKSTLLRTIAGLLHPLSGSVSYDGKQVGTASPAELARMRAFVGTQKIRVPGLTCHNLVAMGRAPYTGWAGSLSDDDEKAVGLALEATGMEKFRDRDMDSISDGECQMIAIARAIAQDTPVILLDEPTAFLDFPNRRRTAALLKSLTCDNGRTVIYSTHDIELAAEYSDLLLLVRRNGIFVSAPSSAEMKAEISAAFFNTGHSR